MIETHAGWLTVDEHDRVIGVKDATIDALHKRLAEVKFTRDKALLQVEVGRRLINQLTGEKERAIEWAVRLEQENAHILDASDDAVTKLACAYWGYYSPGCDVSPALHGHSHGGIRAVLGVLGGAK